MVEQPAPADEIRRGIARRALGGQALTGWWVDDWKPARTAAVNSHAGWTGTGQTGQCEADGVHVWFGRPHDAPADVVVKWSEIRDIVRRGATPERREAYEEAFRAYVEQMAAPLPHPYRRDAPEGWDYYSDPENVAHWAASGRTIRELARAERAIIEAGCARELVQDALW